MNKVEPIIALGVALGMLGGTLSTSSLFNKTTKGAKAVEEYIAMEASFFTNWTDAAGTFAGTDARFWGENYSFEAMDTFFRGESAEGWTGTLTSRTWDQSTQYVYFTFGGAKDYDVEGDPVHLVFHYGSYSESVYNNTFIENPMMFRYFKIPDEKYQELMNGHDSFEMYLEIVDAQTAGYGFANFGWLHPNQTLQSTGDAMRWYLNHLSDDSREWEINKRKEIYGHFSSNPALSEVFFTPAASIDDGFENNNDFLNHWYFDYNYFNNYYGNARRFGEAISTADARTAESSNMPYNKTGNGLFKGWWDDAGRGGFIDSDAAIYRFVSRPFVLSNTGIISIKMAGRSASLHVIDAENHVDLAWADCRTYNGEGGQMNIALGGMNTVTMVRHYINLEEFVGRTIQLAIADVYDSGWAASYFDELVTNYTASEIGFKVDKVQQVNSDGTFYAAYKDVFINSTHIDNDASGLKYNASKEQVTRVDGSDVKLAHDVWKSYVEYARDASHGTEFCNHIVTDEMKAILGSYNGLSEAGKRIVCRSYDYDRQGSGDWWVLEPTLYTPATAYNLSRTLQYLGEENNISVVVYGNINAINRYGVAQINTAALIIISISFVFVLAMSALYFYLRKKRNY